jgi:hypothetical protein
MRAGPSALVSTQYGRTFPLRSDTLHVPRKRHIVFIHFVGQLSQFPITCNTFSVRASYNRVHSRSEHDEDTYFFHKSFRGPSWFASPSINCEGQEQEYPRRTCNTRDRQKESYLQLSI